MVVVCLLKPEYIDAKFVAKKPFIGQHKRQDKKIIMMQSCAANVTG